MALSAKYKLSNPALTVARAFFSFPFKHSSKVASPDLKLYAFLTSFGAKALNKTGNGTLSALIEIYISTNLFILLLKILSLFKLLFIVLLFSSTGLGKMYLL